MDISGYFFNRVKQLEGVFIRILFLHEEKKQGVINFRESGYDSCVLINLININLIDLISFQMHGKD